MKILKHRPANVDLEKGYMIRLEIGFILALALMIVLFRVEFRPEKSVTFVEVESQQVVTMEEIVQTKHIERPPAPPRPAVPVEVPNDEYIIDEEFNFDAELDLDNITEYNIPEPPKPEEPEEAVEDEVFVIVERMPQLIGGIEGLMKKIKYPDIARQAGIEGRVFIQFIINEKGEVVNPVVVRGVGGGLDEVAINAIKEARFTPGLQRGKPVKVKYVLPIIFRLSEVKRNS